MTTTPHLLRRRQLLALPALLSGCAHPPRTMTLASLPPAGLSAHRQTLTFTAQATLRYWVQMPRAAAAEPNRRWPLMVFLHGSGERGKDLDQVRAHGPWRWLDAQPDLPFIVVAPQVDLGGAWDPHLLHALLQSLEQTLPVDPNRVVATGLSMGGYGTWAWAIEYPHDLAAIAPVCGIGDEDRVERIRDLPVWAFHGGADTVVPVELDRRTIAALRAAGGHPRWTEYPGVGHDAWTAAYADPELYAWLLAQRRPAGSR